MTEPYNLGLVRTDRGLIRDKGNYVVDPRHPDFAGGAIADGVHDDTVALTLAFAYATAIGDSLTASAGTATRPAVDLGSGKYRVTSTVDIGAYASVIGNRAAILPDAGVTAFSTSAYQARFRGVQFIGGAQAVAIASGNIDTCTLHFDECEFQDQTDSCIGSDTNSASTLVSVDRCRFYMPVAGTTIFKLQCLDQVMVKRSWITCGGVCYQVGSASKTCNLTVEDCLHIPSGGSTVWFKNYGYFTATKSRFTGESAATFCENYGAINAGATDIKGIVAEDNQIESSGSYAVKFFEAPNVFIWRRNRGNNPTTQGFYFDAAMSLSNFRSYICDWDIKDAGVEGLTTEGLATGAALALSLASSTRARAHTLTVAAKVLQISNDGTTQYGVSASAANYTQPSITHMFGASVRGWAGDTTAYNGSASETFVTALNGLTTGWYTAVFDIEVTGTMPVTITLIAGVRDETFILLPGKHVICLPTYFIVAGTESVGYSLVRLNSAKTVGVGPIRVFSGACEVDTQNNVLYGTAAPTALRWEKGDRVINNPPVAGQPLGWRCTVAGTPGTWVAEANL